MGASVVALGYLALRNVPFDVIPFFRTTYTGGKELFQETLIETVSELHLSAKIGEAYLTSTDNGKVELNLDEIGESIRQRLGVPASRFAGMNLDKDLLTESLAIAIKQDFLDDNICYLKNWYLSITECRLSAIKFLVEQSKGRVRKSEPEDPSGVVA